MRNSQRKGPDSSEAQMGRRRSRSSSQALKYENFNLIDQSQEDRSDAKEHDWRVPGKRTVEVLGLCLSRDKVVRTAYVIHLASACVMCLNSLTWRKVQAIGWPYCLWQQAVWETRVALETRHQGRGTFGSTVLGYGGKNKPLWFLEPK